MSAEDVAAIEAILGYEFADKSLCQARAHAWHVSAGVSEWVRSHVKGPRVVLVIE